MTYYIIITTTLSTTLNAVDAATWCSNAIRGHASTNQKPPSFAGEPVTFMCAQTVADVKKLNLQEEDTVLICLAKGCNYSNQNLSQFNLDNIERTSSIYSYIKSLPIKINNLAVSV